LLSYNNLFSDPRDGGTATTVIIPIIYNTIHN